MTVPVSGTVYCFLNYKTMKSPPSPLQSAARGHQKLVLEPLFLQGAGGTKLLGYGLCEVRDNSGTKNSSFRCTMKFGRHALSESNKSLKRNGCNNTILLSRLFAMSTRPSSASTFSSEEEKEEDDYEVDDNLSYFRGLVLDLSYRPINIVCWKRAICLEFLDKADVLEYYDQTVSSPGGSFYIPAVLRIASLLQAPKHRNIKVQISRKNIYGRDLFTCQYCGSKNDLTLDHIFPISRGGKWTWENLVTACNECNSRKGHKTLEEANMKLMRIPKAPKEYYYSRIPLTHGTFKMLKNRERIPDEWNGYLSKQFLGL